MISAHHKRQPTVVTYQPFIVALQFNYPSLRIELDFCDELSWVMCTTLSLVSVFETSWGMVSLVYISRLYDVVNMHLCDIIEVRIFRIHEGLEHLSTNTQICFVDHFLRHGFQHNARYKCEQPFAEVG